METAYLIKRLFTVLLFMILASGCVQSMQQEIVYDQNSWETIIPGSCLSFSDGCNNCRRSTASGIAACTRKACVKYKKPVCLDGVN